MFMDFNLIYHLLLQGLRPIRRIVDTSCLGFGILAVNDREIFRLIVGTLSIFGKRVVSRVVQMRFMSHRDHTVFN